MIAVDGAPAALVTAGRRVGMNPEWAKALADEGMTHQQIAEVFYRTTSREITRQAVTRALAKLGRPEGETGHTSNWPWKINTALHLGDRRYREFLAVRKREQGFPLTDEEDDMVRDFVRTMDAWGTVITYHFKTGWWCTARRPDDKSWFVLRRFDANGQPLLG